MKAKKIMVMASAASLAAVASAEVMDRPKGIEIGEHLTLRPYVSLSYTYDSNVDSTKHSKAGNQWVVNPGLGAEYLSENWKVSGAVWYQYHAYNRYSRQLNTSSYGEFLKLDWADSLPNERGWRVMFNERFQQISQDDDMSNDKGRGVGRAPAGGGGREATSPCGRRGRRRGRGAARRCRRARRPRSRASS